MRYLSLTASEIKKLNSKEFIESIKNSEGRLLVSENIVILDPLLKSITNSELAAAMGADILLLNLFDVQNPEIKGMPKNVKPYELIKKIKEFTGRSVGVNLEPVDPEFCENNNDFWKMTKGRLASVENVKKLKDFGVDFIVLTGNPGNGITNKEVVKCTRQIKNIFKNEIVIFAGKMHGAGMGDAILKDEEIKELKHAGADVILIPAPGTIPGTTVDLISKKINLIHDLGLLSMTSIGTSQEGADLQTIKTIALNAKMCGTDIHHIGDTGYPGIAVPENITSYSIAIKGIRHTYFRMACSIKR
ncbi:PEP phosphonomutase [Mesoplasma tabanidae]|uniref:PEP phosphonomutase n=2 Tax=Mesoplasma tabanidae TaxID=219745 RepID=A0A2K8P8E9_9MOLU|nr:PEP phosphonomutase [Mesoplasma tabanidae]ATZ21885.1 PEP phosphonomutase [Mesoplasma tabanidae]